MIDNCWLLFVVVMCVWCMCCLFKIFKLLLYVEEGTLMVFSE